ncbi:MAG TPA: TRAP transporter substrate-binding protein [Bacillota bacterium]
MKCAFRQTLMMIFLVTIFLSSIVLPGCQSSERTGAKDSEGNRALDFSHFFPPSHEQEAFVQQFIDDVEKVTDGEVKITSYSGSSLAAPDEQFAAASTGAVDFSLSVHSYNPNEFPLTSVMELPFMSDRAEKGSEILWTMYEEFSEFADEYEGTKPLWLFTSDPGQIYTVGKPIKSIEDLEGMRIRSPSAETNEWLENLGATPVSMPMNENYEALERGVVDGTIAPWEAVKAWNLDEVIDYATIGDFYMTTFYVVMNEDVWKSLSNADQEAIEELVGERMSVAAGKVFDRVGEEAVKQAKEKGIEIYELSEQELEKWKSYIDPTIEQWIDRMEDQGLPGQEVYDRAIELNEKLDKE